MQSNLITKSLVVLAVLSASAALGYYLLNTSKTEPALSGAARADNTVAVVNGEPLLATELVFLQGNGAESRAELVDRYVTQAILAQAAEPLLRAEIQPALSFARRDILARGYVEHRARSLATALTSEDIAAYYKANLSASMFNTYRLRFKLFTTKDEATTFSRQFAEDAPAALGLMDQFKLPAAATPGQPDTARDWVRLGDLPYGLGAVAAKLKKAELSEIQMVREGFIVVYLEDIAQGKMPAIAEIEPDIRRILADTRLQGEIRALRKKADIRLK